ncbi:hypothetical protein T12_15601 [Trichinella patagoniensis]|uniref:Uncharacterized protein n=1 Tax=Trichinella patagoniensis TaxID=990121 RepID=A0A0V0Z415_9BILA|nr:hypothetical protein T12_15601 [Trichinella patagoniensis]
MTSPPFQSQRKKRRKGGADTNHVAAEYGNYVTCASLCAWVIVVPRRSSCILLRRLLIPRCNKRSKRLSGVCFVTQSLQIVWSLLSSTWRAAPPATERTPETFASCLLQGKCAAVRSTQTVTSRKRRIKRRLSRLL